MNSTGDFWFEDQRDVWVGRVDVVCVFMDGFIDDLGAILVDDQDVTRGLWPLQR